MCRKSARKIYRDGPNGGAIHIGWIVGGEWFTVYALTRLDEVK